MRQLPPKLPERGPFARLYAWLNQIRDYTASLTPVQSLNTLTSHTSMGVSREGTAATTQTVTEEGGDLPTWI